MNHKVTSLEYLLIDLFTKNKIKAKTKQKSNENTMIEIELDELGEVMLELFRKGEIEFEPLSFEESLKEVSVGN